MPVSLFDIAGPIMIGPSSSHVQLMLVHGVIGKSQTDIILAENERDVPMELLKKFEYALLHEVDLSSLNFDCFLSLGETRLCNVD